MKRIITIVMVIAVLGAGVWYAMGGGAGGSKSFGAGTGEQVTSIDTILKSPETYIGQTVTVEGKLTEVCPTSGCWWYTEDATGKIRTSSEGADFTLSSKYTGKMLRTTGKVVKVDGGAIEIAATGAALK